MTTEITVDLYPALDANSPLRVYPSNLPQHLFFTVDALAVTFDMLSSSFTRLYDTMSALNKELPETEAHALADLAIGDAWSFISATYQFLSLATGIQGDRSASVTRKNIPLLDTGLQRKDILGELRNKFQHMNNELGRASPDQAFLGTLLWHHVTGERTRKIHQIIAGSLKVGQQIPLGDPNPPTGVAIGDIRIVELDFRGSRTDLLELYLYVFQLCRQIETELARVYAKSDYASSERTTRNPHLVWTVSWDGIDPAS